MKARFVLAALLVLALSAGAQTTRTEPSTPEERARALQVTRKLEKDPLGPQAVEERNWLTKWIIEIPDITVPVCDEVLKPLLAGEVSQYRYSKQLVAQELAGAAAYMIEHPKEDNSDDVNDYAINRAGLESALNAYEAIVKSGAKGGKWGPLEEMLKKRQAGQVDDYVRAATLRCITGETITAQAKMPARACGL